MKTLPGVDRAYALPQGCFGIDAHKVWVHHDGTRDIRKQIEQMPEVQSVKPGYNF